MEVATSKIDELQAILSDGVKLPHNFQDCMCFTDSYIAGMIPRSLLDNTIVDTFLDYAPVVSKLVTIEPIIYTLNQFNEALNKYTPIVEEKKIYKECSECKGDGEIACGSCGHIDDCGKCGGDGEVLLRIEKTGKMVYDPVNEGYLKLNEAVINPNFLSRIISACDALNISDKLFVLTHNSNNKASIIEVSECKFLIMPVNLEAGAVKILATI